MVTVRTEAMLRGIAEVLGISPRDKLIDPDELRDALNEIFSTEIDSTALDEAKTFEDFIAAMPEIEVKR